MPDPKYRQWQALGQPTPRWLQGPNGTSWQQGVGQAKDDLVTQAKNATKARFPFQDFNATVPAAPDSLQATGRDRVLERYPGETDAVYAGRVRNAFAAWRIAGTAGAIIGQLNAAGYPNVTIFNVFNATGPGGATPWPPDSNPSNYSRFWVYLQAPFPTTWLLRTWGDGVAAWGALGPDGTPYTWGSTATQGQVNTVRGVCAKWKGAHEICAGIWANVAGTILKWDGVN